MTTRTGSALLIALAVALAVALVAAPLGAQGGGATKSGAPPKAGAKADTTSSKSAQATGGPQARVQMSLDREVFTYNGGGRRDPMISLTTSADIRPLITEIQVIGIAYDEEGTNHLAILRNIADKKNTLYRVRVGQMLGRMRVTQITRTEVVFTVDEIGVSRQERLSIRPDTTKRTP